MATIAAFINGPGLGQPVVRALNALRVGDAFVPGICIVLMAIMLDRVTTAASEHGEQLARGQSATGRPAQRPAPGGGAGVTVVCVYLSRHYVFAAKPWESDLGDRISERRAERHRLDLDELGRRHRGHLPTASPTRSSTSSQYVLAGTPWFVTAARDPRDRADPRRLAGRVAAVICLAGVRWLELWNNAMITLTATLVATVFVMILAAVFGVWMGRSHGVDRIIRPLLDAGQTLPPFVYLIPVLALFGATRFTAIVAAVAYAAPAAIKIVADGIKAVSATTVEAAESAGAITIQIITKVQIPMARSAFTVAANQGLLYVLSMVVIGGLVGAGALGYDVVAGFKQLDTRGRGLAAGFSIVLLGVMLDRITTYAARRAERAVLDECPQADPAGRGRRDSSCAGAARRGRQHPRGEGAAVPSPAATSTSRSTTGSATRRTPSWSAGRRRSGSAAWSTTSTSTSRSPGRASPAARSTRSWRTGATPS